MGMFFVYMLKSSVCLALFYLFYRLLLSKETFHRFNRLALLGVLAFSCLLPLVEVTLQNPVEAEVLLEELMLVSEAELSVVMEEAPVPFPWRALVLLVYVLGILFFLGRHIWSLARMCRLLRTSRREKMPEGITLFVHNEKVAPFSWMKTIVLSEQTCRRVVMRFLPMSVPTSRTFIRGTCCWPRCASFSSGSIRRHGS